MGIFQRQLWILILALWLMMSAPCRADDDDDDDDRRRGKYAVEVLTADIRGAGTNASVRIYLEDRTGRKTEGIQLNNFFRTDFQRGQHDTFDLRACDTAMLSSDLTVLTLERDHTGMANDWYVDHVTVTVTRKRKRSETYIFPLNRWVLAQTKYRIPYLDTSLPADDPFPEQRLAGLQHARRTYKTTTDLTQPAFIESLPVDEEWSPEYQNFIRGTSVATTVANKQSSCPTNPWSSLDQLECVFTDDDGVYPRPLSADRWQDDAWFGSQRLAGADPTIIRLATEIPANLSVTEQDLLPFLEGHSLSDVITGERLFVCDLELLEPYRNGAFGRIVPSPIALFYLNDQQQLMPIAIQLFQQPGPDNPVFFPSDDPYTWLLAKMWYNLAEGSLHQSVTHLYLTHLVMETFNLATHRELSQSHPIFRLLKPHLMFTLQINGLARSIFFTPTGVFNVIMNIGSNNVLKFGSERFFKWRVDVDGTFPKALEERGLLDSDVLPNFPYREDGLPVYDAVKRYVTDYVSLYYRDDAALTSDPEIQTWAEKLAAPRIDGGYGLQGVPLTDGKLVSRADLVLVLTSAIFTSSAQHAAVNFEQYEQYSYVPNSPMHLTGEPPKDKNPRTESDILQILPVRPIVLETIKLITTLSQRGLKPLGTPMGSFIVDPPAVALGKKFQKELQDIEKIVRGADAVRDPPYKSLYPSYIPNSIGI